MELAELIKLAEESVIEVDFLISESEKHQVLNVDMEDTIISLKAIRQRWINLKESQIQLN